MKSTLINFFLFLLPIALISSLNSVIVDNVKENDRIGIAGVLNGFPADRLKPSSLKNKEITQNTRSSAKEGTVAGTGVIQVSPATVYDNDVQGGGQGINRTITITNTGVGVLLVSSVTIDGANANQFVLSGLPVFPATVATGDSISFFIAFNPTETGLKTASISISSDDATNAVVNVPVRGLGTAGLGGTNEPSLQSILDLYEIEVNVGDDDVSTNIINSNDTLQRAPLLGDEISIQKFLKADSGNVTVTPLAVFGPTANNPVVQLGWYVSGILANSTELFTVSNDPVSNGQAVSVNAVGSLTFDPATDTFGFYSSWPFFGNRRLNSEDALNKFGGSIPHHVRVYPYKKNGIVEPNAYVIAFEEHTSGFDYQDLVFVVHNVMPAPPLSNPLLFIENTDKFPANDHIIFSRIQIPFSRDGIVFNDNHDSVNLKIHNKGINPLIISGLTLSNDTTWKIEKFNGVPYVAGTGLPLSVASGAVVNLSLRFIAKDQGTRVQILQETLTVASNDNNYPSKRIFLHGLWQYQGEGGKEPYAQEVINLFGFRTKTGFSHTDPDRGDSSKLKGDEIKPSYFVRADTSRPVSIRQLSAYHGCCNQTETLRWYEKDSTSLHVVFTHIAVDGQSVLPRRSSSGSPAGGTMNPPGAFGFKIGGDWSDALKNPGDKIGIRIWKVLDSNNNIVPNSYIISNDYLGTSVTNYDYEDNTYYISNLKPYIGTAYSSELSVGPSALDFGEKVLQTSNTLQLAITNLGQVYTDGSQDPAITIDSIAIAGENRSEFSAVLPAQPTLDPQQGSSITVNFSPGSQGLKIADLLIYYSNLLSPKRVPLYGIAKATGTVVTVNYRINSGAAAPITINGKTWSADDQYSFDNLEPYINPAVSEITATDEDSLYFDEQSSNADRRPFRYQLPLPNGDYWVRLHFAEVYWGAVGSGLSGGAGSRVMSATFENKIRLINFDVVQEVGVASAVIKNLPVTVTDGNLDINFTATANRPSLSALEVYNFDPSIPLAVYFLEFNGSLIDKRVELDWVTGKEMNSKYYVVERSTNNVDFISLDTIPANNIASENNYNFIDEDPQVGNNYYRIKEVDVDGQITYSKIIRIDYNSALKMQVFPNPATNKVKIRLTGIQGNQNATLSIQSVSGSLLKRMPVVLSDQMMEVDISTLSTGMYIISVSGDKFKINKKLLKYH